MLYADLTMNSCVTKKRTIVFQDRNWGSWYRWRFKVGVVAYLKKTELYLGYIIG